MGSLKWNDPNDNDNNNIYNNNKMIIIIIIIIIMIIIMMMMMMITITHDLYGISWWFYKLLRSWLVCQLVFLCLIGRQRHRKMD